jgi:hypothetical protein
MRLKLTKAAIGRSWSVGDDRLFLYWWMRSSRVWMRSSRMWIKSSRVWIRSSRVRMRSSRVVRAFDSRCRRRNCPGLDPSFLRHSGIWGAADEVVLNIVHKKRKNPNNPPIFILWFAFKTLSKKAVMPKDGFRSIFVINMRPVPQQRCKSDTMLKSIVQGKPISQRVLWHLDK